jgi:hypothetical protein
VILWQGPSAIDGRPIVAIATGMPSRKGVLRGANAKTGRMTQVWILPADIAPWIATSTGDDARVCGGCALRPLLAKLAGRMTTGPRKRVCYLTAQIRRARGPSVVWRTFARGRYRNAEAADVAAILGNPKGIRWGAWGDPLAIPADALRDHEILAPLVRSERHTGYTHRWSGLDRADALWAQGWLMASADEPSEALEARSQGWRTFRARGANEPLLDGERACPAAVESGARLTCADCRQCDGTSRGARRPSFSLVRH